jgi:hypothetical protein
MNGNRSHTPDGRRQLWPAGLAMAFIATIAAVISYNDGLFVARLAGNHGRLAYLYPALPDGLIVICLIALYQAAKDRLPRPRWATGGLLLGAGLTLAMNTGAGIAHTRLDALVDGMIPVVFFVAVEVLIWTIRRGRAGVAPVPGPATPGQDDEPDLHADMAWVLSRHSQRQVALITGGSRARVGKLARAESTPAGADIPVSPTAPAGATLNGHPGHG